MVQINIWIKRCRYLNQIFTDLEDKMPQIIWILFGISGHSVARQHKTSFRPAHQYLNFPQHDLYL